MIRKAALIEINVYEGMVPLVSGYLQAYAMADSTLKENFQFTKYTNSTKTPFSQLVKDLSNLDCDVYAFSCYIWNMELVKTLLQPLLNLHPNAQFLLGGPQVMHHAHEYLDPQYENLIICNGEGEKTYSNYLHELLNEEPDFANIKGISFYKNQELITTEPEDRIKDMDEIPSPFLTGLFDSGSYHMSIIETNRGCPFRCGFCFWGAATNDRVYKLSEERVEKEITWLSEHKVPFIYIADANWGMLKRDIEFSRHIAKQKEETGLPVYVYFSAAKNSPDRVAEITEIFTNAGLINSQPISMQTLHEPSLVSIDRKNIKLSAFESLQTDLNAREISSFIELIWPLPGETLDTFKTGIQTLFEKHAGVIVVYSHLLLHNTPLYKKQKELGFVTRIVRDGASEAHLVVETAEASNQDFEAGMWYYYIVLALYNTRALHSLSHYLHSNDIISFVDFYSGFVEFCKQNERHPFTQFVNTSIDEAEYYDVTNYPIVYHGTLHEYRAEFEDLLYRYVSSQDWWENEKARVLFEIDMLNRIYIYSNTPLKKPNFPFQHLNITEIEGRKCTVEIPENYLSSLDYIKGNINKTISKSGSYTFQLDHKRVQHPLRDTQSHRDNADYCYGIIMRSSKILPVWTKVELESSSGLTV